MGQKQSQQKSKGRVEQLLALNENAFAVERYAVAHYLLTLALASAIDRYDLLSLKTVESRATQQATWLDTYSSILFSAIEPGDPAIFRALATDARYFQLVIRSASLKRTRVNVEEST